MKIGKGIAISMPWVAVCVGVVMSRDVAHLVFYAFLASIIIAYIFD